MAKNVLLIGFYYRLLNLPRQSQILLFAPCTNSFRHPADGLIVKKFGAERFKQILWKRFKFGRFSQRVDQAAFSLSKEKFTESHRL